MGWQDAPAVSGGSYKDAPAVEVSGITDQQRAARAISGAAGFGGYAPDIAMGLRQAVDAGAEGLAYLFGDRKRAADVNQSALDDYKQTFGSAPGSDAVRSLSRGAVAAAALPMRAASLPAMVLQSGAQGSAADLMAPAYGVNDADYAAVKGKQAAQGFGAGAALGGILGTAGRVLGPSEAAQALKAEGITPTIGQTMGGLAKLMEEKLSSLPVAGDIIKMGQASSLKDFNRAIYNRILAPLGQKYDGPVGQEGVGEVQRRLSQAYDDVLGKMGPTVVDDQFRAGVNQLDSMLAGTPGAQQAFRNVLREYIAAKVTQGGTLPPSVLKDAESSLGDFVRNYKNAPGDGSMAANAVAQLQAGLRQMAQRSNPEQAPVLQAVNKGYAELVQLERAANSTKVARNEGIVTPADYLKGIKQSDTSVRDRVFARGDAMNQDLAQAADKVLSSKYPDSGSIGRGLAAALAMGGGGAFLHPAMALGALYLPGVRQLAYGASGLLGQAAKTVPYLAAPAVAGLLGQ